MKLLTKVHNLHRMALVRHRYTESNLLSGNFNHSFRRNVFVLILQLPQPKTFMISSGETAGSPPPYSLVLQRKPCSNGRTSVFRLYFVEMEFSFLNGNTGALREIFSKLTIKTPEQCQRFFVPTSLLAWTGFGIQPQFVPH